MEHISTFDPLKKVRLTYMGETIEAPESTTLHAITSMQKAYTSGWEAPIAAIVDNRLMSLESNVYEGAAVEPVFAWQPAGEQVYRRTLTFLLQAASRSLFPNLRLIVGQSLAGGYFYQWIGSPPLTEENAAALEKRMRQMVADDLPIHQERWGVTRAMELFKEAGMQDRVLLLRTWWHETVRLVRIGNYFDIYHGPVAPSTGVLQYFAVRPFPPGIILQFSEGRKGENPTDLPKVPKILFDVYMETYEWNKIIGVSNVGQLNEQVLSGGMDEIIRVSEGLHEKKIASIADMVVAPPHPPVVLIAGPSSAGKTTFSKRLAVQLKVAGKNPVLLSTDDYYIDREKTPKDENGEYDFESIHAVDLPLFNQQLADILQGREVLTPRYSFERGRRLPKSRWMPVKLTKNGIILIEGIHALNDMLTEGIPPQQKFKIYVSALSQLSLDDANRISTTDVRLLRRLVRDRLYRGCDADTTIAKWPSVKRGEMRNIFPFQGEANVMFNSTLPYELSVLKVYAMKFLLEVPRSSPSFMEAYRLMKFLDMLVPVFPDRVPHNSIIREFIGGSFFHY